MKNSKVPANCDRDTFGSLESSILHIKKSLFGLEDPCEEYHRALMLDPSYEVNPFIALFDLVVRIAFQPLGYLGEKVGSFFQGVMCKYLFLFDLKNYFYTTYFDLLMVYLNFQHQRVGLKKFQCF